MRIIKFLIVWIIGLLVMGKFIYPYLSGAGIVSPSAPSVLYFLLIICWSVISLTLSFAKGEK